MAACAASTYYRGCHGEFSPRAVNVSRKDGWIDTESIEPDPFRRDDGTKPVRMFPLAAGAVDVHFRLAIAPIFYDECRVHDRRGFAG